MTEIKHRAVHALHQTMERFEEWFPGEPGIVKVAGRHDATGHVDLSDIQKVLRVVKERADQAAALYRRDRIPVAAIANMFGMNPIELWFSLAADDTEVFCCAGEADERAEAVERVLSKPKWIVDPMTLRRP